MKVLHLYLRYSLIGGIPNYLYHLVRDLSDKYSVDVKVLACNSAFRNAAFKDNNLEVLKLASTPKIFRMPIAPAYPIYLKRLGNVDIIHFHHPFPLGELSYLFVHPATRVVVTWHSDIINQKRLLNLYKPFLLKFLRKVDVILPTTKNYIESSPFLKKFQQKCKVVPLGIDFDKFRKTAGVEISVRKIRDNYGEDIILFIGKLRYYKGVEYLIRAMKRVNAILIIIGEGPLESQLKQLVKDLRIINKVKFLPHLNEENIVEFYHACKVFVLPSVERSEAFGIVQLEAMACGKPVVSTNLPSGVPFVNQDGKTGFVVPPRDSRALSLAINELLSNDKLRIQMERYGKDRVEKEFTTDLVAKRTFRVYQSLLTQR